MSTGKWVSYIRVSTKKQGHSGLGLEAQRTAINNYLNGGRWTLLKEVQEVESGKRNDRPELANALRLCKLHKATLIIAKLDRLARNVHFISSLMESEVDFVAVDFPDANRLTVHILAAVAEHEAKMIGDRTKAALASAKVKWAKQKKAGKPYKQIGGLRVSGRRMAEISKLGVKARIAARAKKAAKRHALVLPEIQAIQSQGATSLRQIADGLNAQGIATARGGQWSAVQVQRVFGAQK
jgi:DNA invertase Pin-like site-specific DNA recombinase